MTVKSPVSAAPCRLVAESRRYLIEGASAAMPLYSSFSFIWLPFLPYAYYMWLPWFVLFLFLGLFPS